MWDEKKGKYWMKGKKLSKNLSPALGTLHKMVLERTQKGSSF